MSHLIVGLGETLWDVFPDGSKLGGAPLNFSCSAAELAGESARVLMVTAVGRDELGDVAVDSMRQHGVETTYVQRNERQTGQVIVELNCAGVASYRFADNSAWDFLEWNDELQKLATDCHAVCFGTLGQRGEQSRNTIQKFVETTSDTCLRILDINLRPPFFTDDIIRESLALANVLKLNDDELPQLTTLCGCTGTDVEMMKQLADLFQLQAVALTRGATGAVLLWGDKVSEQPGISVDVVDTVGAGDAFTAAMVLGMLAAQNIYEPQTEGKSDVKRSTAGDLDHINRWAVQVAAYVCSQAGATMSFPAHLTRRG